MTLGHYESSPKVPKHKWLVHVEKNPYVTCQEHNPDKHHLYKKYVDAQEQVLVYSSAKDIYNWHGPNAHAKFFLLNLHVQHDMNLCHQKTQIHQIYRGKM